MYLIENITGLCSRIEYGKTGDEVAVIDDSRELWLVEGSTGRFFVNPKVLTNARIENPIIDKKPSGTERLVRSKTNSVQRQRPSRPDGTETKQGSLY